MFAEKITKLSVDSIKSGMIVKMYSEEYSCDLFARVLSIGPLYNVLVPDNANLTPIVLDINTLPCIEAVYDNVQDTMRFYISVNEPMATKDNLVWKRMSRNDLKSYMEVETESGSIGTVIKDHHKYGDCIIVENYSLVGFEIISDDLIVKWEGTEDPIAKIYTIGDDNITKTLIWER